MSYLPLIIAILFGLSAAVGIFGLSRAIMKWQWLKSRKVVWLEITPPLSSKRNRATVRGTAWVSPESIF
jgi:hypothetical protein